MQVRLLAPLDDSDGGRCLEAGVILDTEAPAASPFALTPELATDLLARDPPAAERLGRVEPAQPTAPATDVTPERGPWGAGWTRRRTTATTTAARRSR